MTPLAELAARLSRAPELDAVLEITLRGLRDLFGYEHVLLLLLDETGTRLYTIASVGYDEQGVGSEVALGEGVIGMCASRAAPMRIGNLGSMLTYARTVRRTFEAGGGEAPGQEIPLPGLPNPESQLAVPAMVLGQVVGVVAVESDRRAAFSAADEDALGVVAALVASAVEIDAAAERAAAPVVAADAPAVTTTSTTLVRFYPADGSTFVDGDYLIKGVAGRLLWALLTHHERDGRLEFTNKELRLDPMLELPEFRDNFESRLILLKRRLDERAAPVRIAKTGRGRFRIDVAGGLRLEQVG